MNSLNKDYTLKTIIQIKSLWDKRLKCLFNIFSVELRELEAKLKAGFMNRERAAQLAEKRAMALDSKVRCNADIFTKLYVLLVLILKYLIILMLVDWNLTPIWLLWENNFPLVS